MPGFFPDARALVAENPAHYLVYGSLVFIVSIAVYLPAPPANYSLKPHRCDGLRHPHTHHDRSRLAQVLGI